MYLRAKQDLAVAQSCPTLCKPRNRSTPVIPVHHQHPSLPNSCLLSRWCHPTSSSSVTPFSSCPQSFPAPGSFAMSQLFASGGQILALQLQHQASNEHPGLISFRMDWIDLAVQGTLKSILQHRRLKSISSSLLAFFIVQLSHPYMTTGKTIALTRWNLVDKAALCTYKSNKIW